MRIRNVNMPGWFAAAAIMSLIGPRPLFVKTAHAAPPVTSIEEVVMYGIDQNTYELLRYEFGTDAFVRIGKVTDQNGKLVKDCEGLAYIPSGPDKGLYASANYHGKKNTHLVEINPLDATATIMNIGLWDTVGLTAIEDTFGNWMLLAVTKIEENGKGEVALKTIHPATGAVTKLMDLDRDYEGVTVSPDGEVYAVSDNKLYLIDPGTGTETKLGQHSFNDIEALEWASGDFDPSLDLTPDVPASWTANGALIAFSEKTDSLIILNPANGQAKVLTTSFDAIECEGLVFTTQIRDSYGAIVVNACD